MSAALLLSLVCAPLAWAQDDPDTLPPSEQAQLDWDAYQDWLDSLTPEERLLLERLDEWEDVLDPDFVERLELEMDGYTEDEWEPTHPELQVGFEAGTVTGARLQLAMSDCCYPIVGVRLGIHTWTRADVALQPLALGYLAVPVGEVQLVGGFGTTSRDNVWGPAGNAALAWAPWDPLIQMQAGLIWGPGFRSIDVSYAWMW